MYSGIVKDKSQIDVKGLKEHWGELRNAEKVYTASCFLWENSIFIYYECFNERVAVDEVMRSIEDCMVEQKSYSGETKWKRITEIFRYSDTVNELYWKRNDQPTDRVGFVAMLKPEMVSSYVFYHYQLQEEERICNNKYGIIGADGNFLFMYYEKPEVTNVLPYKGLLKTCNSPKNWHEVMEPHFTKWDGDVIWKNIKNIASI